MFLDANKSRSFTDPHLGHAHVRSFNDNSLLTCPHSQVLEEEWHKPGDKCPNKNNQIVSGSSACRGCPEYLHDEKDGYVWCDPDMSYGRLK